MAEINCTLKHLGYLIWKFTTKLSHYTTLFFPLCRGVQVLLPVPLIGVSPLVENSFGWCRRWCLRRRI
jgi:hypothetical protein